MARTDKLRQSQLELQAGQSGESATQRSHEGLINTRQRNADRAESARQFDASVEQRNLDRYQRAWESNRQERARRDAQRAANQAQKPRTSNFGGEGYLAGQEPQPTGDPRLDETKRQFDASQQLQREQMGQQQQQFETSTDLQAASKGLTRTEGNPAGNPGPDNPRLAALQQEMDRRGREQMGQGLEQAGRKFVPTPESMQAQQQNAELAERDMRVKEQNVALRKKEQKLAHDRLDAQIAGARSAAERKELEAQQKQVREDGMQFIKSSASRLDRFMKGDYTQKDMQTLRNMLKNPRDGVAPVGMARALYDEVEAGEIGPRVTQFLTEQVAAEAIDYIYATGYLPDGDLVDFGSAGMQEFSRRINEVKMALLPQTVAGKLFTDDPDFNAGQVSKIKRGYSDRIRMMNKLTALLIKNQKPSTPLGAMDQPQKPAYEQRRPTDAEGRPTRELTPFERSGGQITPEEAARKAGQSFDRADLPTARPQTDYERRNERFQRDRGAMGNW